MSFQMNTASRALRHCAQTEFGSAYVHATWEPFGDRGARVTLDDETAEFDRGDLEAAAQEIAADESDQINSCPDGVLDFDELMLAISKGTHDIDAADFARRLNLGEDWDWSDVRNRVEFGALTAQEVDNAIHAGLR